MQRRKLVLSLLLFRLDNLYGIGGDRNDWLIWGLVNKWWCCCFELIFCLRSGSGWLITRYSRIMSRLGSLSCKLLLFDSKRLCLISGFINSRKLRFRLLNLLFDCGNLTLDNLAYGFVLNHCTFRSLFFFISWFKCWLRVILWRWSPFLWRLTLFNRRFGCALIKMILNSWFTTTLLLFHDLRMRHSCGIGLAHKCMIWLSA